MIMLNKIKLLVKKVKGIYYGFALRSILLKANYVNLLQADFINLL